ncbi:MAG: hypothetical protein EA357_10820 [Micavibrio sp.]|nr:MAG: hypothetical protein EA357_10820 [Micavibrio sp.]
MQHYAVTDTEFGNPALRQQGCVLVIGNLDGVHNGHRALLRAAKTLAAEKNVKLAVMSFAPHPRLFFAPDAPRFLLTDDETKAALLAECGVDCLYSVQFNAVTAAMSALDFIKTLPVATTGCGHVIVGEDFRFGKNRLGDVEILKKAGGAYGYDVTAVLLHGDGEAPVSSSRIRDYIRTGDIAAANALLGRSWFYPLILPENACATEKNGICAAEAAPENPDLLPPADGYYTGTLRCKRTGAETAAFVLHNGTDLVKIYFDALRLAPSQSPPRPPPQPKGGSILFLPKARRTDAPKEGEIIAALAERCGKEQNETNLNKREYS